MDSKIDELGKWGTLDFAAKSRWTVFVMTSVSEKSEAFSLPLWNELGISTKLYIFYDQNANEYEKISPKSSWAFRS